MTSCKMKLIQTILRINLKTLLKCLNRVKLLGPKKRQCLNKNSNSSNINMKMRRRNLKNKSKLMSQWSEVSNHQTVNPSLAEKKLKLKSMKWNKSSWTREESKKNNTTNIEKHFQTKLNNWKRKIMRLNLPRS